MKIKIEGKRKKEKGILKSLICNFPFVIFLLQFVICNCLFIGCGKKESKQSTEQVAPRPKPKIPEYVPPAPAPKYTYKGNIYRDPLIPAGGAHYSSVGIAGESGETMTGEKMATLQLKGIFRDEKVGNIAIISETSGDSYILKNGKLYNRKNKIVRGVAGIIGKNSATLFSNDIKIELKLKKPEEERK